MQTKIIALKSHHSLQSVLQPLSHTKAVLTPPLAQARPDIFPVGHHDTIFGLENFHRLGSAILSRSFHVEEWKDPSKEVWSISLRSLRMALN